MHAKARPTGAAGNLRPGMPEPLSARLGGASSVEIPSGFEVAFEPQADQPEDPGPPEEERNCSALDQTSVAKEKENEVENEDENEKE